MDHIIGILRDKISGDIVFSENPGKTMKKWRKIFEISQKELAEKLGMSPSVISDYESDRRKSPGINFIRRIIEAMLEIDRERGYKTVSKYRDLLSDFKLDVIIDMREFDEPVDVNEFAKAIDGSMLTNFEKFISGYTIVDSIKAILSLNSYDFYRLYGFTTERALIFTKVSTGRSPMVAVRVANLKPAVVVLHGINAKDVDGIAIKLAEIERIPLIATQMPLDDMIKALRNI